MKSKVLFWGIISLALIMSAWIRVGIPYDDLMGRFPSVDAYYHLMAADYIYDNWPEVERYTTELTYPEGQGVGLRPLNNWLMATIAKFGGFTVDAVGTYLPPILGILILIPTLFIGWVLWNKWAGLIGVVLLATIQGEFMGRTSLAFCDHHALEVFLSTMTVLFVILSLKRHWYWSFGAGICLGLYLYNWAGAPLLSMIILMVICIQAIISHWRHAEGRSLWLASSVTLGLSCVMFTVLCRGEGDKLYMLFFIPAALTPHILYGMSKLLSKYKFYWYPTSLILIASAGIGAIFAKYPIMAKVAFMELGGLTGTIGSVSGSLGRTISEVQPLFAPYGDFTLSLMWGGYGLVFIIGLLGLGLLGRHLKKPEILFMFIWSLGMFAVTLMQRRFGYYLAVNACLLSGYLSWAIMTKYGWRKRTKKEVKKGLERWYFSPVVTVIGVFIIMVTMVLPNTMLSMREAQKHPYAITPAWSEATQWLSETHEGDYGVLSWWDYGYWIAREGGKSVPCHPGGGSTDKSALFFTSLCTADADEIADKLKVKYVVVDYMMVTNKFYAMPILAERENYTDANYNDSMVCRLYFSEDGIDGYREVFESTPQYKGHGQVKIYERYKSKKG